MHILFVHDFYGAGAPSVENRVFEYEKGVLEKYGHVVATYVRHFDEIRSSAWLRKTWGEIKGAASAVGNPFAVFGRLPNRSAESLLKCDLRQSGETLVKEI